MMLDSGKVSSTKSVSGQELSLMSTSNSHRLLSGVFRSADEFYALFYLGLYCEARGEPTKAEAYMRKASQTQYAQFSGDYMASCAKVHCQLRRWT
jgi:hypothetical protein